MSIDFAARFQTVLNRSRTAERQFQRPPGSVELLAVSKTHPASAVAALAALGQRHFGEKDSPPLPKVFCPL